VLVVAEMSTQRARSESVALEHALRPADLIGTPIALRFLRVLCKDDGQPITRQGAWSRVRYAARDANVPTGATFSGTRSARIS
jgi:hypothetical protein